MVFRLATFNVENLMNRFDFSGFKHTSRQDRALALYDIEDEEQYKLLEAARVVAHSDDARQLTALALAATRADIICLQEVDNLDALKAFERGYLYKMIGQGYRHKVIQEGNDGRGIDVAFMAREETSHGKKIEIIRVTSHAHVTFKDLGLHNRELEDLGIKDSERIFRRDCLGVDVRIDGQMMTFFGLHLKAMGGARDGRSGRDVTMPVRIAELKAVRHIITQYFSGKPEGKRWAICGDFNDYQERIKVSGDDFNGYQFEHLAEEISSLNTLLNDGFAINSARHLDSMERWSYYHTRGPQERHLCQLDYILLSPHLAKLNPTVPLEFIRKGQPWRTVLPSKQHVERFPRVGWDRPKSSDHCPLVVELKFS